jgi:hypothetical protein
MVWQDIAITLVSVVFAYAIIPQIIYGFRKRRGVITYQFSILNILAMIVLTIVYFGLNLIFSTIISTIITIFWIILLIQKIKYKD